MAYFSNAGESEYFENQCARCVLSNTYCPIASIQSFWNYKQLKSGYEPVKAILDVLVSDNDGCVMWQEAPQLRKEPAPMTLGDIEIVESSD